MKRYPAFLLWLLIGSLFFASCKSDGKAASGEEEIVPDESFAPFYKKFHEDSLYQMAHIVWPLQGVPPMTDSASLAKGTFFWKKEEWVMQRDFDDEKYGFKRKLKVVTPLMVEEEIVHNSNDFGIVRRFAKIGDEWKLVYYSGLQRIK